MKKYDLIIVGLGIYGSCIAAEAGNRGLSVLAVDQFDPPHDQGSSHGDSRIFRLTAVESEEYVPVARRALDIWKNYNSESGNRILSEVGFAIIERPQASALQKHHGVKDLVATAARFANDHGILHEVTTGAGIASRFPGLSVPRAAKVFLEPGAFVINADEAVRAALRRARSFRNVEILVRTKVHGVRSATDGVEVMVGSSVLAAKRAILCTGPWQPAEQLGGDFAGVRVLPQVTISRSMTVEDLKDAAFPAFVNVAGNMPLVYGVPPTGGRDQLKIGLEQDDVSVPAPGATLPPAFIRESRDRLISMAGTLLPGIDMSSALPNTCYYTVTADSKFSIKSDRHGSLITVSCCSGHGFKYAPAFAEQIVNWGSG